MMETFINFDRNRPSANPREAFWDPAQKASTRLDISEALSGQLEAIFELKFLTICGARTIHRAPPETHRKRRYRDICFVGRVRTDEVLPKVDAGLPKAGNRVQPDEDAAKFRLRPPMNRPRPHVAIPKSLPASEH